MHVILPEALSLELYLNGRFEEGLTTFLLDRLRPKMTFFDVGAHFGYFTLLASHLVGPEGSVHAFEPTPSTFAVLESNATKPNVTLRCAAVWSHEDELDLRDFGVGRSMFNSLYAPRLASDAPYSTIRVPAVALDDYVEETGVIPDFVKIDAESAEMSIIEGMTRTIDRHGPLITVEVGDLTDDQPLSSRALLERLTEKGYSPFEYADGEIRPHTLLDQYGYDNILLER
jgi:FkbM family methyltransferase